MSFELNTLVENNINLDDIVNFLVGLEDDVVDFRNVKVYKLLANRCVYVEIVSGNESVILSKTGSFMSVILNSKYSVTEDIYSHKGPLNYNFMDFS